MFGVAWRPVRFLYGVVIMVISVSASLIGLLVSAQGDRVAAQS